MSEDQLKAFLEAVKSDPTLQDRLKTATGPEVVVAIAKDAGFFISPDDIQRAKTELSEEELEGVAGGGDPNCVGGNTYYCLGGTDASTKHYHCSYACGG
jgi:predicted ribosomally synthesized peptide with nif11-like leader